MKKPLLMLLILLTGGTSYGTVIQPVLEGTTLTDVWFDRSQTIYLDLIYDYTGPSAPGKATLIDVLLTLPVDCPSFFVGNTDITVSPHMGGDPDLGSFNGMYASEQLGLPAGGLVLSGTSWEGGEANGSVLFGHIEIFCVDRAPPFPQLITSQLGGWVQGLSTADYVDVIDFPDGQGLGSGSVQGVMTVTVVPGPAGVSLLILGALALAKRPKRKFSHG